jgi:hypothetical protein
MSFVSWAYLTRHKITASPTGKELVISFPNGSQQRTKLEIVTLKDEQKIKPPCWFDDLSLSSAAVSRQRINRQRRTCSVSKIF